MRCPLALVAQGSGCPAKSGPRAGLGPSASCVKAVGFWPETTYTVLTRGLSKLQSHATVPDCSPSSVYSWGKFRSALRRPGPNWRKMRGVGKSVTRQ